ncbi:EAL domain-containing protein [Vibrio sp. HN007]|uniref:sensor domain-containing protein n=1 Tax=Vibrio iocasae TaxID=3098914 RepID=UPI0035D527CC
MKKKRIVYTSIFNESKVPMLIISPTDGEIVDANPAAIDFYGYNKDIITRKYISQINQLSHSEVAAEMQNAKKMKRNHFIFKHKLSNGKVRDVEVYSSPIRAQGDQYLFSVIHDITTRVEAENQLKIYAKLFTSSNDMLAVIDTEQKYLAANDHYLNLFELSSEDVIGRKVKEVLGDESFHFSEPYINKALLGTPVFYERQNCNLHKVTHLEVRYFPFTDIEGKLSGIIGVFRDVSELKKTSERLSYLAHHDALTGLPNRLELQERLHQYVERAKRFDSLIYALFIDLDRFKNVNDSMGHSIGDELLVRVARRMEQSIRSTDIISRVSGDEFVAIIEVSERGDQITHTLGRIREAFIRPFEVTSGTIHITASIGVSQYPDDTHNPMALISNADAAMYRAKQQGRNQIAFFSKDESERLFYRSRVENALRGAMERNELELYFQPQVHIKEKTLSGLEVLLRWTNNELGSVSPSIFIPMAEQIGLMGELGSWVLRKACNTAVTWRRRGLQFGTIAVNVSGVQLRKTNFYEEVLTILTDTGLPPTCLELEITESFVMGQFEDSVEQLRKLRAYGVTISVDDFGTGYSSLSYLKRLPLDRLKVDRSFVADIEHDEDSRALVLSIIALAKTMHFEIIAEGVENQEQACFLTKNGCDHAQGYFFEKPLSVDKVKKLLAAPINHKE